MRSPEMWLNPGDHSSAITAEFCNFFCGCGCYSPLQSPKILSLVSSAALAGLLCNIHHFSQETNTTICMSTILQFSFKGVFQSWGINRRFEVKVSYFHVSSERLFFASGGSNQLGRTNHLSGTETFIPFFFCDANTEDLTSSWICTEQGNSCLYAPELWKLPRESHAVPS